MRPPEVKRYSSPRHSKAASSAGSSEEKGFFGCRIRVLPGPDMASPVRDHEKNPEMVHSFPGDHASVAVTIPRPSVRHPSVIRPNPPARARPRARPGRRVRGRSCAEARAIHGFPRTFIENEARLPREEGGRRTCERPRAGQPEPRPGTRRGQRVRRVQPRVAVVPRGRHLAVGGKTKPPSGRPSSRRTGPSRPPAGPSAGNHRRPRNVGGSGTLGSRDHAVPVHVTTASPDRGPASGDPATARGRS